MRPDRPARVLRRAAALGVLVALACSSSALALRQASPIDAAASALRSDPIYVDPGAQRRPTPQEVDRLRRRISEQRAGPLYIAILPREALDSAGGDATSVLRELATSVGRPGTYGAVIGERTSAVAGISVAAGTSSPPRRRQR